MAFSLSSVEPLIVTGQVQDVKLSGFSDHMVPLNRAQKTGSAHIFPHENSFCPVPVPCPTSWQSLRCRASQPGRVQTQRWVWFLPGWSTIEPSNAISVQNHPAKWWRSRLI